MGNHRNNMYILWQMLSWACHCTCCLFMTQIVFLYLQIVLRWAFVTAFKVCIGKSVYLLCKGIQIYLRTLYCQFMSQMVQGSLKIAPKIFVNKPLPILYRNLLCYLWLICNYFVVKSSIMCHGGLERKAHNLSYNLSAFHPRSPCFVLLTAFGKVILFSAMI